MDIRMAVGKILSKIKAIFRKDPYFLWSLIILLSLNPVASLFLKTDWIGTVITLAIIYFLSCLLSLLFTSIGKVGMVCKNIVIAIVCLYDLLALFCIIVFKTNVDVTIIETLLATNMGEIKEFVSVFFPWWLLLLSLSVIAAIIIGNHLCVKRKVEMGDKQITGHLYVFTYVTIVMAICHHQIANQINSSVAWRIPFENLAIDLNDYEPDHIDLYEQRTDHPEKIVVIIGESHSKGHTSLYGYEKKTNPRLEKLVSDSMACVFEHVISPATATTECFKYILSTRKLSDRDIDWYLFPSLITAMKSAGYHTSWFSNQEEVGLYDNMASCYAHICNEYTFNTNEEKLDGNLLGMHKPSKGKEFVVYHLMGQHVDFAKRYPKNFVTFKASDYDKKKCYEPDVAAHYDNACVYNDYVVSSIMNEYKNEDAVVFYFPDHGLDVFESSPAFYGHTHGAKNRTIGYQIPFIVYTSDTFKKNHSVAVDKIKSLSTINFCTADAPFIVMDMAGYSFMSRK